MTDVQKIEAAIARIVGEWDHPSLVLYGPLRVNTLDDVLAILRGDRA